MTIQYKKLLSFSNFFIIVLCTYFVYRSILTPDFFDFEHFPLLTSLIIFWAILRIYEMVNLQKVTILNEKFQVEDAPSKDIHYKHVEGVVYEGDELLIIGKEKHLRFSSYQISNFKAFREFLCTDLNFKNIPFYKHLSFHSFMKFIYVAGTLVSLGFLLFTGSNKLKYYLPLKCIDVVEVEATLRYGIEIYGIKQRQHKVRVQGVFRLNEYPGYTFRIPREKKLENSIMNLDSNPISIPKDAKVKVKIRKSTYEIIRSSSLEYASKNQIQKIYSLEYNGVILFQKRGMCQ